MGTGVIHPRHRFDALPHEIVKVMYEYRNTFVWEPRALKSSAGYAS